MYFLTSYILLHPVRSLLVSLVSFFLSILNNTDNQLTLKQLEHYKYIDKVVHYLVKFSVRHLIDLSDF